MEVGLFLILLAAIIILASDAAGLVASIDAVITNITRNPTGVFLAALEPGVYPIRDAALANGLLRPIVDIANNKITWHEGATGLTSLSLNTQISADTTTEFDFGTTNINGVVPNMLIAFNTEIVRVVSVDRTAGTCEVTRGFGGTTALAEILTTVVGKVISVTPSETADAGEGLLAYGAASTNYLHYFEEVVEISDKTQGQLAQHDTPEADIAYQIMDKFKKISRELAHALWLSATNGTGSSTYQTMNSLRSFIPAAATSTTAVSGALKFTHLDTAVQNALDTGVVPDTLYVPTAIKKGLAQWANSRLKTVVTSDPAVAGGSLDRYLSAPGPQLDILPDTSLIATDGFICRKADLHAGPVAVLPQINPAPDLPQLTGIRVERMGRKGAYQQVQVLAYFSSQLAYKAGQQLLTGISSVDSDGL